MSGLFISVIFTVPKSIVPSAPVVFVVALCPGNVTWNSAPDNFTF